MVSSRTLVSSRKLWRSFANTPLSPVTKTDSLAQSKTTNSGPQRIMGLWDSLLNTHKSVGSKNASTRTNGTQKLLIYFGFTPSPNPRTFEGLVQKCICVIMCCICCNFLWYIFAEISVVPSLTIFLNSYIFSNAELHPPSQATKKKKTFTQPDHTHKKRYPPN